MKIINPTIAGTDWYFEDGEIFVETNSVFNGFHKVCKYVVQRDTVLSNQELYFNTKVLANAPKLISLAENYYNYLDIRTDQIRSEQALGKLECPEPNEQLLEMERQMDFIVLLLKDCGCEIVYKNDKKM
jgi:hypothetical protein